jgi:hypothetical protein
VSANLNAISYAIVVTAATAAQVKKCCESVKSQAASMALAVLPFAM